MYLKRYLVSTTCIMASIFAASGSAYANPEGGVVSAGSATITSSDKRLDIIQNSNKAVLDWRSFDINADEVTQFHQPNSNAIAVNRINDSKASNINGQLKANGNLVLINQNGIMFGNNAKVDVNGLVATTADIDNNQFMNGTDIKFSKPGKSDATVVNKGTITAKQAGLVGLVAPNVINEGVITANMGRVHLASGDTATVDMYGDKLMEVAVSDKVKSQLVSNTGKIEAQGGKIAMTAAAGKEIVNSLINVQGELKAPAIAEKNGEIIIFAEGSNAVAENVAADKGKKQGSSTVIVQATLDVSGKAKGEKGGKITVTGDNVTIKSSSKLDASGNAKGGEIKIGGDYQGKAQTAAAKNTTIEAGVKINADAIEQGDGGKVIVWSDGHTGFYGDISARGGSLGGNGGFAETSGKETLTARGNVDLRALTENIGGGVTGSWLLDPTSITIYNRAYGGGTNNDSTFLTSYLEGQSASSNIILSATGSPGSITFDMTGDTLTLAANRNLTLTSTGDITTASNGAIVTSGTGSVTFTSDLGIALSNSFNITTGGGAINMEANHTTPANTANIVIATANTLTSNGGDVNLNANAGVITSGVIAAGNGTNGVGNITFTSSDVNINGNLSGKGTLALRPYGANKTVRLNFFAGDYNILQTEVDKMVDGWNLIDIGRADGANNMNIGTVSFKDPVMLRTWAANLYGNVTGTDNASLNFNSVFSATIQRAASIISTSGGAVTFSTNGFQLNGFNSTINTLNGALTFNSGIANSGAASNLTINSGSGATSFNTINGLINLNTTAGSIVTNGTWGGTTALSSVTLTTANTNVTLPNVFTTNGNVNVNSGTGTVTAGAITTGAGNITLTSDDLVLNGDLTGTGILTLAPYSNKHIRVNYYGGDYNIDSTELNHIKNGWNNIVIGATYAASGLDMGDYTWTDSVTFLTSTSGYSGLNISGNLIFNDGASATFTGAYIDFNNSVTTNGGSVTFNGTVTPYNNASVTTANGNIIFNGDFRLNNTASDFTATSNNAAINFANSIYAINGTATGKTITVNAGTGAASFGNTVEGNFNLTANAGNLTFNGAWGATTPLNVVVLNATNSFAIPAIKATTLALNSNGTVTQTGAVNASGLSLTGSGGIFNLTNTGNAIDTLSGLTGTINLVENSGYNIGTVNYLSGITTTNLYLSTTGTVTQSAAAISDNWLLSGVGGIYTLTNSGNSAYSKVATNTGTVNLNLGSSNFSIATVNGTAGITATNAYLATTGSVYGDAAINATTFTLKGGHWYLYSGNNIANFAANVIDLYLYNGSNNLSITAANSITGLTATNLYLAGDGTFSQTNAITATTLGLQNWGVGGTYNLTNSSNNIGTIAAKVATLNLNNGSNNLVVGTSNSLGVFTTPLAINGITGTDVTLTTTGTTTQSQAISATNLKLLGAAGIYNLATSSNAVANLAAGTGSISLTNGNNNLSVVTLGATTGITTTGNTLLDAGTGTINISQAVATGSGNLSLTSDNITLGANLSSTGGTLTLQPTSTTRIVRAGTTVTNTDYNLTAAEILYVQNGWNQINIGRSNSTAATYLANVALADPVTFYSGTGATYIDTNVNSINLTDNGSATFASPVYFRDGSVTTQNQNVTFNSGLIFERGGSINTNGGSVLASGAVTLQAANLNNAAINTSNGNITFSGVIRENTSYGALTGKTLSLNAGTGTIAFGGTVNGLYNLTATAKNFTFNGIWGGSSLPLGTVTLNSTDSIIIPAITAGNLYLSTTGTATQTGALTITDGLSLAGTGGIYNLTNVNNSISKLSANTHTVNFAVRNNYNIDTVNGIVGLNATNAYLNSPYVTVSQSQKIAVNNLLLSGAGAWYNIWGSNNAIDVIASSAGVQTVDLIENSGYEIGTVNGVNGLSANYVLLGIDDNVTVTQSQAINADNLRLTTYGANAIFNLTNSGNAINTLAAQGLGTLNFVENSGFDIGTVNFNGVIISNFNLSSAGTITQSQKLEVTNLSLAGTGGIYNLTNTNNKVTNLAANTGSLSLINGNNNLKVTAVNGTSGITTTGNTSLDAGTATITTTNDINVGAGNLTLTADDLVLGGALTGTGGALTLQPTSTTKVVRLNSLTTDFNLNATELGYLTNGWGSINIGRTDTTAGTYIGASNWYDPLYIRGSAPKVFSGAIAGLDDASFDIGTLATVSSITFNTGSTMSTAGSGKSIILYGNIYTTSAAFTTNNGTFNVKNQIVLGGTGTGLTVNAGSGSIILGHHIGGGAAGQLVSLTTTGGFFLNGNVNGLFDINVSANSMNLSQVWGNTTQLGTVSLNSITSVALPAINATNLYLSSTGTVSQTGAITANDLRLAGTGGIYNLNNTGNAITNLAANTGSVSFTENSGYNVTTVNGTTGITTTGSTALTSTGGITLLQDITSYGATLTGPIIVGSNNRTINGNTGTITTTSTLSAGANNITLSADDLVLGGNMTGTGILTLQPSSDRVVRINYGTGDFNLDATELGYIKEGWGSIVIGRGNNGMLMEIGATSWTDPITFKNAYRAMLEGNLDASDNASVTFTSTGGSGWINLIGNITTQNQNVSLISPGGYGGTVNTNGGNFHASQIAVTTSNIGNGLTVNTSGGNISISGLVAESGAGGTTAGKTVSLNSGTGSITFGNKVDGLFNVSATGNSIVLNNIWGNTTALGNVSLNSATSLTLPSSIISTGNVNISAGTGTITANAINTGAGNLTLTADDLVLNGNLNGTGTLTIQPYSLERIMRVGTLITTDFNLSTAEVNQIQNGWQQINIGRSVDGGTGALYIANSAWKDPVTFRNGNTTSTSAGNIYGVIYVDSNSGSITTTDDSSVTFTAGAFMRDGSITTQNRNVTFNNALVFERGGSINTNGGNVSIGSNLNMSAYTLGASNINTSNGNITISGSLTESTSQGTLTGKTLTLNSGTGTIAFGNTVNGGYNISATGGSITSAGVWGANSALGNITLSSVNDIILPSITSTGNVSVTTSTGDILTSANGGITTSGSKTITLTSAKDILFTNDFDLTSATGLITLAANRNIIYSGGGDINNTTGGIIINSDRDQATAIGGGIVFGTGSTLTTTGGDIILGGGASPSNSNAIGTAATSQGIGLTGVTIDAGGGSITLNGQGYSGGGNTTLATAQHGIYLNASTIKTTGTGAIFVNGFGRGSAVGTGIGAVLTNGSSILANNGSITVYGTGGGAGSSNNHGILFDSVGTNKIESNGSSAITVQGSGTYDGGDYNHGVVLNSSAGGVFSASGDVYVRGINNSGANSIGIVNTAGGAGTIGGASATGKVEIVADNISFASLPAIRTTGQVQLRGSSSIGIAGAAGSLQLTSALLDSISAGSFLIGRNSTSSLITANAYTWSAPVTMATSNNNIVLNGQQTLTGSKTFTATTASSGNITLGAGGGVTTGSGNITLTSAGQITTAGAASLTSASGNISLNAPVKLGAALTVSAGTGAVAFGGTVEGAYNLTASGATFTHNGKWGRDFGVADVSLNFTNSYTLPYLRTSTLTLATKGTITQTDEMSNYALVLNDAAGTYNITNANNFVQFIRGVASSVDFYNGSHDINLGAITADKLALTTTGNTTQAVAGINVNELLLLGAGANYALNEVNNIIGSVAANTGSIDIYSKENLKVSSLTNNSKTAAGITTTGATKLITAKAFEQASNITAGGAGTSVTIKNTNGYTYTSGAINPGIGRFLVWGVNPSNDSLGSLAYNFRQYNATYGTTTPAQSDNGFLYSYAPTFTAGLTGTITKEYDNSTAATLGSGNYQFTASPTGYAFGQVDNGHGLIDIITLSTPTSGAYGSKDVANNLNVAVSGITISAKDNATGANVYGYTVNSNANANIGSITPKGLTVTATAAGKTYGDLDPSSYSYTYSGLANGESTASFTGSLNRTAGENAGDYNINKNSLTATGNYTIATYDTGTFTIDPATLTITANDKTKTYGDANPTFDFAVSGLVNSDLESIFTGATLTSTANATTGVGTYGITLSGGSAGSNYTIVRNNGSLEINPATLTVTANDKTKTYGDANPTFDFAISGLVNSDADSIFTGATLTSTADATTGVGTYNIVLSGGSAGANYTIVRNNGSLEINPATLTVTANDKTKIYGDVNPAFDFSITGLVNSDADSIFTGATLASTANATTGVGTYAITLLGGSAGANYTIVRNNGSLEINPATLTVTANDKTKIYGAANPTFDFAISGLVNSDADSIFTGATLNSTANAATGVGTYNITLSGGSAGANYTIVRNNGSLEINPATLTVTANDKTKIYGAANPTFDFALSGLVNSDDDSIFTGATLASTADGTTGVGTYTITLSGGSAGSNYTIVRNNGSLVIDPRTLTITADNKTKVVGDSNPIFTASYNGFQNGDNSSMVVGLNLTSLADTSSLAGSYAINASGASINSNYTISYVDGALTITSNAVIPPVPQVPAMSTLPESVMALSQQAEIFTQADYATSYTTEDSGEDTDASSPEFKKYKNALRLSEFLSIEPSLADRLGIASTYKVN